LKIQNENIKFKLLFTNCGIGGKRDLKIQNENIKFKLLFSNCGIGGSEI